MKTANPIPEPGNALTPHLILRDAAHAIAWYVDVLGAVEDFRLTEPGGKVGHAELKLGGGRLMLADEYPDFGALSPGSIGGTPVRLHLYVADVDTVVARAEAAGATLLRPVQDEFYGDRTAMLVDPFGHLWQLASRREEVSPEQMQRRWSAMLQGAQ
ncbi:VOC family protein [Solimonas sp. K1W22B-7]|uniref:VOC family protein n=1 Tax=Solimonas sp. K1W22B-7 TaxID=2303331 RepID=UPI000E3309B3|nr:VOC family protein [Solimonas sp. K1W22B-7]AXQ30196.1 VOC family protein [Solimonas sp. K1W22B-7]